MSADRLCQHDNTATVEYTVRKCYSYEKLSVRIRDGCGPTEKYSVKCAEIEWPRGHPVCASGPVSFFKKRVFLAPI